MNTFHRLVNQFNEIHRFSIFSFFVWGIFGICNILLTLQFQLVEYFYLSKSRFIRYRKIFLFFDRPMIIQRWLRSLFHYSLHFGRCWLFCWFVNRANECLMPLTDFTMRCSKTIGICYQLTWNDCTWHFYWTHSNRSILNAMVASSARAKHLKR